MKRRRFLWLMSLLLLVAVFAWSMGDAIAKKPVTLDEQAKKFNKVPPSEQKAAAKRAAKLGLKPGVAGVAPLDSASRAAAPLAAVAPLPGIEGPGGVPHYFGPYGNWAFSPLPKGPVSEITLLDGGTGYNNPIVTISDAYGTADVSATATATAAGGVITGLALGTGGSGYSAPVVIIEDDPALCGGASQPECGTGAIADATIGGTLTGGIQKFVDPMPDLYDPRSGPPVPEKCIPLGVPDIVTYPGSDYYEIALQEFAEKMHSNLPATKQRGYVQINNGTGNLYNAETNPTGCVAPGLPVPAGARTCTALDNIVKPAPIRYLGPTIVARGRVHGIEATNPQAGKPVPVRIKFINELPVGKPDPVTGLRPGDLFLPVDETVPGSGLGPALPGTAGQKYTQNRATIHLHGNSTVWLSDGNVHQWITPASEDTPYPAGVSARNVPDMGKAGCADLTLNDPLLPGSSGCMTFFYTNAQSARLQFYHDHALGITRLNVYAGEAGGYVITDAVDQDMIKGTNLTGVNPNNLKVLPDIGIPLIIQDKTFVDADTVFAQDPTWNWGTGPRDPVTGNITAAVTGDLWYPHVYMTVQNPWDLTGTNGFGRWHYGPWFNPPTPTCVDGLPVGCIEVGPVPNPYYTPICETNPNDPGCHAWEPPMMPGNPNPSIPGESFLDTPLVNGAAYPYLEVEPRAYRFRVLNASNDRMLNLQLYVAADKTTWQSGTGPAAPGSPTSLCAAGKDPTVCTEVKMVSVINSPANQYADTPSGIPDTAPEAKGPDWWQIGTEGGFMPKPVVVPQQPIGYNLDPAYFNFGVVNQHSLFLGSAERADVVVDFSAYAGKTLILYNDSPAPVPAGAAPYDFFTGNGNQMDGGGAPNTQPGYGPNTRTIMQIRVGTTVTKPTPDVTLAKLNEVFAKTATKRGVFEVSQDPIIVPQAAYNSAYNNSFPTTAVQQYIQIADTEKTFQPINEAGLLQSPVTLPLEMKAMHDEMGGVYDTLFGRMSGMLGLSNPTSPVHVLIPYGLASPPTDLVKGSVEGTPIGVMPDGTQIWRIFHNGVDTHTIHTHLFHTQLINRIGQDGQWYSPSQVDPIELGWKDTFRVNPLEITYLAMRPTVPTPAQVPFEVPDSVRLIDPTLPEGATLTPPAPAGWFDPEGNPITEILNHTVNFGWEYVWHCHILSHEEMDMMHSLVFAVPPSAPSNLVATWNRNVNSPRITLTWTDNSPKEVGFTIQRATDANFTTGLRETRVGPSAITGSTVTFTDASVARATTYWYRVLANGPLVGDTAAYAGSTGFPTMSADSMSSSVPASTFSTTPAAPNAPSNLTATAQAGPQVRLTWRDNATNESYFVLERCSVVAPATTCNDFAQIAAPGPLNNTGNVTYNDTTVTFGNSYRYQVKAVNPGGSSASYATLASPVIVPAIPPAPTNVTAAAVKAGGINYTTKVNWASAVNPTSFTLQRATNASFTTGVNTATIAGTLRVFSLTVPRNTTYYYRIRANNSIGGSSAWVNALPFPIRTGP